MGKFSDYVGSINEQTNILRENLTNATGVDCSKKSIGACADVVADYVPDLEKEEVYYDRPSWYPDIKTILNSAPEIEKDGVTYVPAYITLLNNFNTETPFYNANSTTASAINYQRATGGEAVLCSDKCNNDIANANADALEVGTTIMHTWDTSKDIVDLNGKDLNKVRWVIIYKNKSKNNSGFTIYVGRWNDCVEIITGNTTLSGACIISNNTKTNSSVEYIEFQKTTKFNSAIGGQNVLSYMNNLKSLVFEEGIVANISSTISSLSSLTYIKLSSGITISTTFTTSFTKLKHIDIPNGFKYINSSSFLSSSSSLKKITIPNQMVGAFRGLASCPMLKEVYFGDDINIDASSNSYSTLSGCYNLEKVEFSHNATSLILTNAFSTCYNLKYVKIPSSVQTLTTTASTFGHTTYIELFNDFDISAVNFTGTIPKDLQWLRDLCIWLKDYTGDTANTMIIGSANLENAQNLWLTFNPDDKRDITWVDAGTEGAINIIEFITSELNWSLS